MIKLSECEEQVMTVIWTSESEVEPDLKYVRAEVNARFNHEWAPQTVSTYLGRLVKKEYLTFKRKGRNSVYETLVELEQYRKERLQGLVEMLYGGDVEAVEKDLR